MILLDKTECPRRADEWAPMAPEHIRRALTPRALALWLEAQSHGDGYAFRSREDEAKRIGWTLYAYRKAIEELIRCGLYVVDRIRDAAGRWSTMCRFRTVSPQVTPKAGFPEVGTSAGIPPSTERKRGAGGHTPETCWQEQRGKPCRHCARIRRARELEAAKAERARFRQLRLDELEQRNASAPAVECVHEAVATRCALCRRAASPPPVTPTTAGMMDG